MTWNWGNQNRNSALKPKCAITTITTGIVVYETLCPQQMLVYKGGQINNVQLITGVGNSEMSHL